MSELSCQRILLAVTDYILLRLNETPEKRNQRLDVVAESNQKRRYVWDVLDGMPSP